MYLGSKHFTIKPLEQLQASGVLAWLPLHTHTSSHNQRRTWIHCEYFQICASSLQVIQNKIYQLRRRKTKGSTYNQVKSIWVSLMWNFSWISIGKYQNSCFVALKSLSDQNWDKIKFGSQSLSVYPECILRVCSGQALVMCQSTLSSVHGMACQEKLCHWSCSLLSYCSSVHKHNWLEIDKMLAAAFFK